MSQRDGNPERRGGVGVSQHLGDVPTMSVIPRFSDFRGTLVSKTSFPWLVSTGSFENLPVQICL